MSEEIKETQEEKPATEETAAEATSGSKKNKINRLTEDELKNKIAEMEKNSVTHSKYYKHLIERKNELDSKKGI